MQTLHSPTQAAEWLRQHVTGVLCTDSRVNRLGKPCQTKCRPKWRPIQD
jgi:hypothetical protein